MAIHCTLYSLVIIFGQSWKTEEPGTVSNSEAFDRDPYFTIVGARMNVPLALIDFYSEFDPAYSVVMPPLVA
jgi:hypothetical protein